jgi:hypothetical protein
VQKAVLVPFFWGGVYEPFFFPTFFFDLRKIQDNRKTVTAELYGAGKSGSGPGGMHAGVYHARVLRIF